MKQLYGKTDWTARRATIAKAIVAVWLASFAAAALNAWLVGG